MHIESLRLTNFKAFKSAEMKDLPRLSVIVGANGSGKSTLFQVFGFLRDAMATNVQTALVKLGGSRGFQEVRSRGADGEIEIELKFRAAADSPLFTYWLSIGESAGRAVIRREVLKYRRGSQWKEWHFLDFSDGKGEAVTNEWDKVQSESELQREDQSVKSPDILAIKGLAQLKRFPPAVVLGDLIENWHVSDFHIAKARPEQEAGFADHLSREGENLALVTEYLYSNHREVFDHICRKLAERVPGIGSVTAKTTDEGRVLLKFQDSSFTSTDPFLARHVSDGTIKMLAYLVLLYDPRPFPLLCVEEPENQLYPRLLAELAEEFRAYAGRGGQVFVSTHSPDFLNATELDEVFWIVKQGGYSTIQRAKNDPQLAAYMRDGDKMGYLWKQGLFPGADPA